MKKEEDLAQQILHHKICYYQGTPEISDEDYDRLEEELRKIAPGHHVLQMIGSGSMGGEKVAHEKKMLSLAKSYELSELKAWALDHELLSMHKIDGVSCSLIYENGKLKRAKTRGDGAFGEDITAKVLWMKSIPKEVRNTSRFEVRGELCCFEENFFHLSNEMEQKKLERPTSQRNIVAGLISRKDNLELNRYINFWAFDYITDENLYKLEIEKFHQLEKLGFAVVEVKKHHNFQGVEESINEAEKFMSDGHYQIDGLVFVYNQLAQHQKLGETAHHPRYKMAFKFRGDSKQTVIEDIEWGVSRNGILTPVALVRPVELSGAMISRVTLHNFGVVNSYKLKQGDEIEIIRSGEVIPKFLSVIKSSESKIKIPQQCPVCKSSVKIEEIRLYCTNPNCVGRARENILNFVQKIGIEDLSFKRLDQLIEYGALTSISDLYRLSVDDLFASFKKEGSAAKNDEKKLANKIYKSIQSSKNIGIIPFFISLGISGGAANKCEKIVKNGINTIEKIKELTVDKLLTIDSFAEKSATDFIQSLQEKIPLIDELVGLGFVIKDEGRTPDRLKIESALFAGKSFCITGALSVGRDLIEEQIKKNGGVVVSSVSKKTNYLLTNETESSSSKFKKAKELQIPIVSEEWLNEKLKKTN